LIELLVVVAIIGMLVALLWPALTRAIKHSQIRRARLEAKQLVTIFEAYNSDTGRYPAYGGNSETNIVMDLNMMRLMTGSSQRVYLQLDPKLFGTNSTLADPWGNTYNIRCDVDDNGTITSPFGGTAIKANVIVWSAGPDRTNDTTSGDGGVNADNITSWR
jgi:general secretion pathway protein G